MRTLECLQDVSPDRRHTKEQILTVIGGCRTEMGEVRQTLEKVIPTLRSIPGVQMDQRLEWLLDSLNECSVNLESLAAFVGERPSWDLDPDPGE